MRARLLALGLACSLAGCAVHYVQQTESFKDKLVVTTIKETRLLWVPLFMGQTVHLGDVVQETTLQCKELATNYEVREGAPAAF